MKITSILMLAAMLQSSIAFSQSCDLSVKKGQKYSISTITYDVPLEMSAIAKFTKMKEAKRQAMIDKHNNAVASGKQKPKSTYDVTYTVDELTEKDNYVYAKMATNINGTEYVSHMICENDTLFLMRKEGKNELLGPQGNFIGYQTLGTKILPKNIKVGDKLPPYSDNIYTTSENTIPTSKVNSVSEGSWKTTITYSVHDVLQISTSNTETINYAFSEVTAEKQVEISGKTYTAYVIESESWMKTTTGKELKSLDGEINTKKMATKMSKFDAKIQKKVDRATLATEGGYIVIPKTEWYVPELGIVNTVGRFYGFINSETKLVSIQ